MRVTLTGASGFIGGHVARALAATGHEVVTLVRPTSDLRAVRDVPLSTIHGDLSDPASLAEACLGADVVVHAAAIVQGHGIWADFRRGVEGTANLLDAMAGAGVRKLVHMSSIGVYGMQPRAEPLHELLPLCTRPEPWNHYIRQKIWAERLVWDAHAAGRIQAVVLRPSATLGPGDRASLPAILGALNAGKMAVLGHGRNRVPFVVAEELAGAVVRAVESDRGVGRAYNLSGAAPVTQAEFLAMCSRATGSPVPRRHIPVPAARLAASWAEWSHRVRRKEGAPEIHRLGVSVAASDLVVDCSAAARDLAWEGGASYESAVQRGTAWLRSSRAN